MANKYITVSNGDGRNLDISGSIDNATGQLSASVLIINTASFAGQSNNGLLQIAGGQIATITGSGNNFKINYNSLLGRFTSESDAAGNLGGDLSGLSGSAKVIGINNVTTGILSASRGGTGTGSFGEGALVTGNGDGPIINVANANKVVSIDAGGNYAFVDKSVLESTVMTGTLVYLYTGSIGTDSNSSYSTTWTKPPGCRFIRVICQGGGGAGGNGASIANTTFVRGGSGGGGGGYADVIFNALNISNQVQIIAGFGGQNLSYPLGTGGSSSFGPYIYSDSGSRGTQGYYNTWITPAGGASGNSYLPYTSAGAAAVINNIGNNATNLTSFYGAPGGGAGGANAKNGGTGGSTQIVSVGSAGVVTSKNGGFNSINPFPSIKKYITNNNIVVNDVLPNLLCSGGGGGYGETTSGQSGIGASPTFGSGGGGGGAAYQNSNGGYGAGGNGGAGYVLIICY